MKQILSVLFVASLSIGAFIGCGDDPVAPEATGTVNVS